MGLIRSILRRDRRTSRAESQDTLSSPEETATHSRVEIGWATDTGIVRSHNEDTILAMAAVRRGGEETPDLGLIVLADGMGGHRSGEIASSLAVRVVAGHILRQFYLPTLVSHERSTDQPPLTEVLVDAIHAANSAVSSEVPGGGTTLTCALMLGSRAYVASVGDSRAYVFADGMLGQVTHDHSVVDRLVELGQLSADEAASHPQKNVLYRALGQSGPLEVDTYVRTIPSDGCLLLCSDGLWGMVSDEDMAGLACGSLSLQQACDALVAAANRAGGYDNISVVLARPPEPRTLTTA
jgi:protein phosphatase